MGCCGVAMPEESMLMADDKWKLNCYLNLHSFGENVIYFRHKSLRFLLDKSAQNVKNQPPHTNINIYIFYTHIRTHRKKIKQNDY